MCRGCTMKIDGKFATNEYLDFLGNHQAIVQAMVLLNKKILVFENSVDSKKHKKIVSRFRRNLIRLKKQYAKSDMILCDIDIEK